MRKGTHSCLTCEDWLTQPSPGGFPLICSTGRRRKVRCSYAPGESKICVNCAKHNARCTPQGDIQSDSGTRNASVYTEHKEVPNIYHLSFFDALDNLRQWVDLPLIPTHLPAILRASAEQRQFVNDPKVIQSEHAPLMKLFNDRRVRNLFNLSRK